MQDKPDALVQPPARDLDPYEAKYMAGDLTLFRSKARMAWQAPAAIGASALFLLVWGAVHSNLVGGLIAAAAVGLIGLYFAVLRVTVSSTAVEIQYGSLGPTIPLESIESVESIVHRYTNFLRWGISPTLAGEWVYTIAGDEGRAVKIVWRNARGRRKVHIIGSLEPEQLADAIRTAQRAASPLPSLEDAK